MLGGANPFPPSLRTTSRSPPDTSYRLEPQPLAEVDVQLKFLIRYIWIFPHLCTLIREQPRKLSIFFPTSLVVLELLTTQSQRESLLPGLRSVTLPPVLRTSRLLIVSENGANVAGSQAGSGGGASETRALSSPFLPFLCQKRLVCAEGNVLSFCLPFQSGGTVKNMGKAAGTLFLLFLVSGILVYKRAEIVDYIRR